MTGSRQGYVQCVFRFGPGNHSVGQQLPSQFGGMSIDSKAIKAFAQGQTPPCGDQISFACLLQHQGRNAHMISNPAPVPPLPTEFLPRYRGEITACPRRQIAYDTGFDINRRFHAYMVARQPLIRAFDLVGGLLSMPIQIASLAGPENLIRVLSNGTALRPSIAKVGCHELGKLSSEAGIAYAAM